MSRLILKLLFALTVLPLFFLVMYVTLDIAHTYMPGIFDFADGTLFGRIREGIAFGGAVLLALLICSYWYRLIDFQAKNIPDDGKMSIPAVEPQIVSAENPPGLVDLPSQYPYRATFVSLLAFAVGFFFLLVGVMQASSRYDEFNATLPADAEVLSFVSFVGRGKYTGTGAYERSSTTAQILFKTQAGEVVRARVIEYDSSQIKAVGQSIRIRYHAEDPAGAQTEAELKDLSYFAILGLVSLVFMAAGFYAGTGRPFPHVRVTRSPDDKQKIEIT